MPTAVDDLLQNWLLFSGLLGQAEGRPESAGPPRGDMTRQVEPEKIDPTPDTPVTGPGDLGKYEDTAGYGQSMIDNYWRLAMSRMPPVGPEVVAKLITQALAGQPMRIDESGGMPTQDGVGATGAAMPLVQGQPLPHAGGGQQPPMGATPPAMQPMPSAGGGMPGPGGGAGPMPMPSVQSMLNPQPMPGPGPAAGGGGGGGMPTPPPNAQPMPMPTPNPLRGPVTPPMPARNPMREQQDQGLLELLKAWDRGWQARNQGNRFLRGPQQGPVVR